MIFKKRALTYIACSIISLFLAGMIWLYIAKVFEYDIYTSCLFCAACILGYAFIFICTYFIIFIFRKADKKILSTVLEILLILSVICGGAVLRCSYPGNISFLELDKLTGSDLWGIIYFSTSILKMIIIYYTARIGIGKVGGFIAVCAAAYIPASSSEYYLPDKQIFFETGVLIAALLFVIWYKRCNKNKLKNAPSRILICIVFLLCGVFAAYYNSLILLMILLLLSMIPGAWKQGLLMFFVGIAICAVSIFVMSEYDGENHFAGYYDRYENAVSDISEDVFDDYTDNAVGVLAEDYSAYYSEIAVFVLIVSAFISVIIMFFGKRLSLLPFMLYFMFVSYSAKRMILYIALFCFAYGMQELHDMFRKRAEKKEAESIEVLSGTVENPQVKKADIYMSDEEYDKFFNSLPVPMSLIDSQCVIKVIDRSKSDIEECWQRRKFRAVVRSLKKYYESEEMSNG